MAAMRIPQSMVVKLFCSNISRKIPIHQAKQFATDSRKSWTIISRRFSTLGLTTAATVTTGYVVWRITGGSQPQPLVLAKSASNEPTESQKRTSIQNQRELRFLSFASVEYEGNIYMTPQDFLESVAEVSPRPRTSRRHLRQNEVESYLKNTPSRGRGSSSFFRNLLDKGIVSYTEYLFLLCVLTEPRTGFQIAFNMFDTDGDQRVDKKEFLVLEHLLANGGSSLKKASELQTVYGNALHKSNVEETESVGQKPSIRTNIWNLLHERHKTEETTASLMTNTTLTVHFFGLKGKDVLKFEDFHRFMESLQTEVLELEFNEFSHGMPTITEEEFAKVLLRYTILTEEEHEEYLDRLRKRIPHFHGISFKDFKEFMQFLNNLDDFTLAMRIYTYADHAFSEVDFLRAVKACTGQTINSHLIHVVFQLFDEDGDGRLSHKEFISVMKERLHRGARAIGQTRWDDFRLCLKAELKDN